MDDMRTHMHTQKRALERAIALIGRSELAEALGVWWSEVDSWRRGEARMPQALLERTTTLIVEKYRALPWTGAEAAETASRRLSA